MTTETVPGRFAVRPESRRDSDSLPPVAKAGLITLCAAKLLLHLFTSVRHYGYFRDELYYLDMARHLDWGYVDSAPLIAVYAKVALWMGGSLAALRILPALAGTALVALSILIARELGGGRFAQLLTGLAVLSGSRHSGHGQPADDERVRAAVLDGLRLSDPGSILRTGDSRLWLWFGVLAGLGLENKHSTLFFGFSVAVALLLTQHRRELAAAVDLDRRSDRAGAVPPESHLADSPSLSDTRRSRERSPGGKERHSRSAGIRQAADPRDASDSRSRFGWAARSGSCAIGAGASSG